ncbi:MAG: extracellular solute-binding protein [Planctomycetota bacterium]|nr:MAG: extracellular solute-binding protein [Planctomycetota bacterium]
MLRRRWLWAAAAVLGACGREPDLVVYCALDRDYSEPILERFEQHTGLRVQAQFDVEQSKTVGLVNRIIQEAARPRADVFWNNEIAHTIRLKNLGLTEAYASDMTRGIPEQFRDAGGHWTGFGARARVIAYRADRFAPGEGPPRSVLRMVEPEHARRGAMAAPLTGTTLTHFTALAVLRGREALLEWLRRGLDNGLQYGGGNADVMRRVNEKDLAWCLTDTDDAAAARRNGHPVTVLFPDQGPDEMGTVLIPNSVCIVKGARHRSHAERFVDFVTSPEVESLLAAGGAQQIPLRPGVAAPPDVPVPGQDFHVATIDWNAVALQLEERRRDFEELLVR